MSLSRKDSSKTGMGLKMGLKRQIQLQEVVKIDNKKKKKKKKKKKMQTRLESV